MTITYSILLGLVMLAIGGEALVRGAVGTALKLGVSPLLVGVTIVGFGTSTPELVTSLEAARLGSPGIAVGNVVGSNITNILLILGLSASLAPITLAKHGAVRDAIALVFSATALCATVFLGGLTLEVGLAFLGALAVYMAVALWTERASALREPRETTKPLWHSLVFLGIGLASTIIGASFLVTGAVDLARSLGVSESIIGLTIVAVGTSLPELVASTIAVLRRQVAIAFGNVVGSNIYNTLGILGVTGTVAPMAIPPDIARVDLWIMLAVTLLFIAFIFRGLRVSRLEGLVLLMGYIAYIGALYWRADAHLLG